MRFSLAFRGERLVGVAASFVDILSARAKRMLSWAGYGHERAPCGSSHAGCRACGAWVRRVKNGTQDSLQWTHAIRTDNMHNTMVARIQIDTQAY